ncbi:hypothetical protein C2857_000348 [Epichloe festucae Fl1]|uniref:histone acetyltransferase n=1 Tax=Epichloe festucae (strain Fl1) TaxID=877507 RepID=A0A7S9KU19_EPIFF|nr:hypothetical protein C2857_000348 [Epichloe festucae Fl1]
MESSPSGPIEADKSLTTRLASVLPEHVPFGIYHVSTPPRRTDALFSAPPNERPDRTYCENHFLTVSIGAQLAQPKEQTSSRNAGSSSAATTAETKKEVLVLGIEIFIYTTAHATTLFVSKADSTGYLPLLDLPKGAASPIRQVCAAFIAHLVEHRRRPGVQFVVSLFARSQGQYLFPGSVDHGGKHVLDDGGLIKWWCRVLDPLIVKSPPSGTGGPPGNGNGNGNGKGYLVVPGLDAHETRALLPRTVTAASSWSLTHPLDKISHYRREFDRVPPRCLIPRFPDDPKSRFRDELDDEAGGSGASKQTGAWKSVKTLDTFWEMMAYRQECSSGRMTGFIWVVLDDDEADADETDRRDARTGASAIPKIPTKQTDASPPTTAPVTAPRRLLLSPRDSAAARSKSNKNGKSGKRRCKLRGPIRPRQPRAKTGQRNYSPEMPTRTAYYYWPSRGRGERIVNEATYRRITEHMLHADFSNLDKAAGSTKRWIREVGLGTDWGSVVVGERALSAAPPANGTDASAQINTISSGLVKRKRADTNDMTGGGATNMDADVAKKVPEDEGLEAPRDCKNGPNFLSAGLVRKKPKS